MAEQVQFRVMGTTAHVVVVGDRRFLDHAVARLDDLERRWSRFIPSSEVSRLNAHAGEHVVVSPDTLMLVECAIAGWRRTGGLFDPTVLAAVRANGYDRDFAEVGAHARDLVPPSPVPAPGCADIECDDRLGAVTMPAGTGFDPGGIGKGLAADLVAGELLALGAHGVLVSVGGDLRALGEPPNGSTWDVAIDDPARGTEVIRVGLHDGAVATSSRACRHWNTASGKAHHLIDPRTGAPGAARYATAAAVTGEAWWAEVVAKAVLIGGLDRAARRAFEALVVTITDAGTVELDPQLEVVPA